MGSCFLEYGIEEEHRFQVSTSFWPHEILALWGRSSASEGLELGFLSYGRDPRKYIFLTESRSAQKLEILTLIILISR